MPCYFRFTNIVTLHLFLFILLSLYSGHAAFAQECPIKFSGHIEDQDTKDKLVGATITIKETGRSAVTDEKGDFLFTGLCPGTFTLLVTHISCDSLLQTIRLMRSTHLDLVLPHARKVLGEVIVEKQRGIPTTGFKKELSEYMLEETKGLSLADALSRLSGVTMLQTGASIAKPVIHGLHGTRILTINNGVRQEAQQWGNEHAPEIDPFIAQKIAVIKGVDELKYGSDAIAGVILIEPRPIRGADGYNAELNSVFLSNNRQFVNSLLWEERFRKKPSLAYRIQGTFKKGANVATPDYRLNNTASEEKNFSMTAAYKKNSLSSEIYYSYFSAVVGIFTGSHIGNISDLRSAIAAGKPADVFTGQQSYNINRPRQEIEHHLIKGKSTWLKNGHKINMMVAGQWNRRKEYDIVRSNSNNRPQLDLTIATATEEMQWNHPATSAFNGTAGITLTQQQNNYGGRYFIPNYTSLGGGAFLIEKWNRHRWEVHAGLRFDVKTIETNRLRFNGDTIAYNFHFSTFAASVHAQYKASENWRFHWHIGSASRAPYINELLSDGIHHGTATYERGNILLKPEKAFTVSNSIVYSNIAKTIRGELLVYTNIIQDFIYQEPQPASPVLTIAGAFPLIVYKQTNALLSGADLNLAATVIERLEWQGKFSYLRARNTSIDDWLIWMPANRTSNTATYLFKNKHKFSDTRISFEWMHVLEQKNVPASRTGPRDYMPPPAAYSLLHAGGSTTVRWGKRNITLGFSIRNMLNKAYRDYMNSMRYYSDEMGRNVIIRVKFNLDTN